MIKRVLAFLIPLTLLMACEPDNSGNNILTPADFLGPYVCKETSQLYGLSTYNVTCVSGFNPGEIVIRNFYNNGLDIRVELDGLDLTIPSQTESGFTIDGDGSSQANAFEFNLSYLVDDGSDIDNCSAIFTRQ
jgi:hypothetical protein